MILAFIIYGGILFSIITLIYFPVYSEQRIKKSSVNIANATNNFSQYILPLIIFTLALGLRYNVGVDYLSYEEIYNSQTNTFLSNSHVEPLYALISFLLYKLNMPYYVLTCIISYLFFVLFIKSFSNYPILKNWGVFFLFTTGTLFVFLNVQRQAIAFIIFLYGIQFIHKRHFFKYLFCIIIAMGFHYSAIILLPFYICGTSKRLLIDKLPIQLSLYGFILILRNKLETLLIQFILIFAPSKYAGYGERLLNWKVDLGSGMGILLSHSLDFLTIILLNIIQQQNIKNNYITPFQRIWIIGIYLELVFESNMVLSRIPTYLTPLKFIILAYITHHVISTWKQQKGIIVILTYFLIISYCIYFIMLIKNGSSLCAPYHFIEL